MREGTEAEVVWGGWEGGGWRVQRKGSGEGWREMCTVERLPSQKKTKKKQNKTKQNNHKLRHCKHDRYLIEKKENNIRQYGHPEVAMRVNSPRVCEEDDSAEHGYY
jgi:hypothetical protein